MRHFTPLFFIVLSVLAKAQSPTVHALRHTPTVLEWYPTTLKGLNGTFYVQSLGRKGLSFNDSMFTTLTQLDANLDPVWARRVKMQRKCSPYNSVVNPDGSLTMLANANTAGNRIYPLLLTFSSDGQLLQTREIVDSSSTTESYPFDSFVRLGNGVEILTSADALLRVNPQGQVSYKKKLYIHNDSLRYLNFSAQQSIPGGNGWVGVGQVNGTNLTFYSRWNDTTLLNLRVYDAKMTSLNTPNLARPHIHPNGEVSHIWNVGSQQLHIQRLQPDGSILWWKTYNTRSQYLGYLRMSDDGHHWVMGSVTPGQAGGIVAHFSPTGDLIKVKGQFKLGSGHGTLTTFEPLPGGDFLAVQKGYTNTEVMFLNRVQPSLEFRCFDTNLLPVTDTSIAVVDSAVTNVKYKKRRYGIKTTTSTPLLFSSVAVVKDPVSCTVTEVSEPEVTELPEVYPNPVTEVFHVANPKGKKTTWVLTDLAGRVCMKGEFESEAISVSAGKLPRGLYTLQLMHTENRSVVRLMKE